MTPAQYLRAVAELESEYRASLQKLKDVWAMINEVLCKLLCHNICCLIQEMYELGIEPEFWSEPKEVGAA